MTITPSLFEAFLKCPARCWLRATGEAPCSNPYAEWVQSQNESYGAAQTERLLAEAPPGESAHSPSTANLKASQWRLAADLVARANLPPSSGGASSASPTHSPEPLNSGPGGTRPSEVFALESHLHAVERVPAEGRGKAAQFIPIRFIFFNKLGKDDRLLLAFDAFVLSGALGRDIATGKIIHGDLRDCVRRSRGNEAHTSSPSSETPTESQSLLTSAATSPTRSAVETAEPPAGISPTPSCVQPRVTKVKTSALAGEVRKRLEKMTALLSSPAPPDLVLSRHCAECEFQAHCRKLAVEKDDLSLLAGMSAKERQKLRSKGIFTVTQLSYTFRPRRRPKRMRDKREKYHHSLKALAIREKKIHIVGSPELKIDGTPVYLDVEGLPDRDFYYLIGLRIGNDDNAIQHSLWADTVEDEGKIWREFLSILETVEQPVLIHYGSYETAYFKRMAEDYGEPLDGSQASQALETAVNLISAIFGRLYFPTYGSGLKEVAGSLGFKWTEAEPTGLRTIIWRNSWDADRSPHLRHRLATYNSEDCQALHILARTMTGLGSTQNSGKEIGGLAESAVHAEAIPRETLWGNFSSPISEFEQINRAARWDYQRERVFIRSGKRPLRTNTRISHRPTPLKPTSVKFCPVNPICPKCGTLGRCTSGDSKRTLRDLFIGKNFIRRRIIEYHYTLYRCAYCNEHYGRPVESWARNAWGSTYGKDLKAYLLFHTIELAIPQRKFAKSIQRLFGIPLGSCLLSRMKSGTAEFYRPTREELLKRIRTGPLAHVDETRANVKGVLGYVWVFTSMNEVAYMYSETREGTLAKDLLAGFNGVLVSDFFSVYDNFECPQQKCLLHLIRDLNDGILNQPFDEELKQMVKSFAELLRTIVETVDRRGLKSHFLRKHRRDVTRFYNHLVDAECSSEVACQFRDRFLKNRNSLFTFLEYDAVPWNNNNAEHAIKAFAAIRGVLEGRSNAKGLDEYLILLSVCQTCKYMGVDFLDFLRSGEKDIHAFAESRRRRRRRSPTSESKALPAVASVEL